MNQIADILDLAIQAEEQKVDAVLATVVRTEGSAYRQAGAMMLICADGRSVGMISGGCLEPHIVKRAFWLTRHGNNVQVYQTGEDIEYSKNGDTESSIGDKDEFLDADLDNGLNSDLESELSFGLGCNGRVHVLFERLIKASALLDLFRQVRHTQQPITIATLVKADSAKHEVGMRINIDDYLSTRQLTTIVSNQYFSNISQTPINKTFAPIVEQLAQHTFHKKNAEYVIVESNLEHRSTDNRTQNIEQELLPKTGKTEWLIQRICPQIRLLICGAGNDVMPLVTMAKLQDWHVTVIDSRPQYATRVRFPQADTVMRLSLEDTDTLVKLSTNAAVAVMSHSLTQDCARLAVLLAHSAQCKYLGQLGPRYRTERLIKEISDTSVNSHILAEGISKLHYPIGYKLGGDGPEALALSIMAQMSAVIYGQTPQASLPNS